MVNNSFRTITLMHLKNINDPIIGIESRRVLPKFFETMIG